MSAQQRAFIAQLATTPLRLYTVTQVRRGEGLTLVDALDAESAPIVVRERMGSETMTAGLLLGCRVMQIDDVFELSGAIYPFPMLGASVAIEEVRTILEVEVHPEDRTYEVGFAIMREWLRQLLVPVGLPGLVDASTGDPLLFVTDHYRIDDDAALVAALDSSAQLQRDDEGWVRAVEADDGTVRLSASIERGKSADRLTVFYRTQLMADEPIPALQGKSPREAMRTPAGLERVKGLLRSYEDNETQSAAQAVRSAVSYRFLWDALGIEPDR